MERERERCVASKVHDLQNKDSRDETDTETGNETTGNNHTQTSNSGLQSDTDAENEAAQDNGRATSNPVGKVTSDEGTEAVEKKMS